MRTGLYLEASLSGMMTPMRRWQMFTLIVSILFGVLAALAGLLGVVLIFVGAWIVAIAVLILAGLLAFMSVSTKRSWQSMVGDMRG
jgi:hypothetical protein